MSKNVIVLGGGYSGVIAAKKLAKTLLKRHKADDIKVTLIDRNPFHTMLTELHEVAAARVEEDSIRLSYKKIFAGRNVHLVMDTIEDIDFAGKQLKGAAGTYAYDILVIAAGSKPTFFGVKGAAEKAYKLWSYDDAVILRERIQQCFREAARETDQEKRRKLLTFFTVGAGFTGTEMAGEMAEWVPLLCHEYEIDPSEIKMYMADLLDRVVPTMPPKYSARCHRRLEKMGVKILLKHNVTEIGDDFIDLKDGDTIKRIETATIIWAAGTEGAAIAQKAAQTITGTKRGRLEADEFLRSKGNDSVYLVGDVLQFVPKGETAPVPQVVENAENSAECAVHNILVQLTGQGDMHSYTPKLHGVMVCVGGRWGSAYVGTNKHKFGMPSFLAMFAKHFVNLIYFIKVMGWTKIIGYMKHEFFTVRNNRSFVGGHFSNKTPSFLLVALRVWLGAVWVFEAVMKIVEGWFTAPMLSSFFGGANAWFNSIIGVAGGGSGSSAADAVSSATTALATAAPAVTDAVSSATTALATAAPTVTDAVSSATGAVTQAAASVGHALINFNFLNLIQVILVSGKDLAHSGLGDYALKLNIPILNWLLEHTILQSTGMQLFMQIAIVLMELLIGLALMGGLFTFPASGVSLVLQFMFITTTGLYLNTVWMIFASVACLIGAGNTIGLDYYAMPYFKRHWKKVRWAKKWYLYND
jgi:NADH:ubiquinone reductase (H+-translocating)